MENCHARTITSKTDLGGASVHFLATQSGAVSEAARLAIQITLGTPSNRIGDYTVADLTPGSALQSVRTSRANRNELDLNPSLDSDSVVASAVTRGLGFQCRLSRRRRVCEVDGQYVAWGV